MEVVASKITNEAIELEMIAATRSPFRIPALRIALANCPTRLCSSPYVTCSTCVPPSRAAIKAVLSDGPCANIFSAKLRQASGKKRGGGYIRREWSFGRTTCNQLTVKEKKTVFDSCEALIS